MRNGDRVDRDSLIDAPRSLKDSSVNKEQL